MKLCRKCKVEKSLEEFGSSSRQVDGKHYYCRPCAAKHARDFREKHPESRTRYRRASRLRSYGLNEETYNAMLLEQDNLCMICLEELKDSVIDHCHETGRVRGILCRPCNSAIGLMKDNPEALRRAADYVV